MSTEPDPLFEAGGEETKLLEWDLFLPYFPSPQVEAQSLRAREKRWTKGIDWPTRLGSPSPPQRLRQRGRCRAKCCPHGPAVQERSKERSQVPGGLCLSPRHCSLQLCGAALRRPAESSSSQEDPTVFPTRETAQSSPEGCNLPPVQVPSSVTSSLRPGLGRFRGSRQSAEARGACASTIFISNVAPFPIAL